ncbi:UDP-glucose 4-epimerase-like isoform X2 [Coccinella septempunctata]|uniref:UDP-glucose 4-epimerase-like isoform X2 n=1 Tax=Coccinella septempunctata TaxID=41139 RepID=UPI001D061634|nr:UDP-glucose 4-epimerase-like isoform X2 [Coccinella septempunctata]
MSSSLFKAIYITAFVSYAIIPLDYLTKYWIFEGSNPHMSCKSCQCTGKNSQAILVTGGGGYVGSHTVVELLNANFTVVAIDNLSNCHAPSKDDKPESLKRVEKITGKKLVFYNVDIRNKDDLDKIFKKHKISTVIHFAALKSVGESTQIPLSYYENNVGGSNNLFQVMHDNGVKSLVYSSSATVYGTPQFLPLTEDHPTGQGCTNPYGKTKYFVEEIGKDLCTAYPEWKLISLRYFNPVGAHHSGIIGEDPSGIPNNLMPYISQVAIGRREFLRVFGSDYDTVDGTGVRDYIHITDLAIGHLRALEKISDPSFLGFQAYNLGTGRGYSVLEVVKAFERASGKRVEYRLVDRRPGDIATCYSDASLAKSELNWSADKDIDEMCKDTWNWQSNNPSGFS